MLTYSYPNGLANRLGPQFVNGQISLLIKLIEMRVSGKGT